jgi:hypothetical protein
MQIRNDMMSEQNTFTLHLTESEQKTLLFVLCNSTLADDTRQDQKTIFETLRDKISRAKTFNTKGE